MMTDTTYEKPVPTTRTRLRQVQAGAGILFASFLIVHLSNVMLAPFGIDAFNNYQRLLRTWYQEPLFELTFVMVPLALHLVCGLWMLRLDHGQRRGRPWRARLHTWAGLFLTLFIFGHILAVRGPSFFAGVYPEFAGLSFSLWYFPAYFYPYYFLLALAGFYHAAEGVGPALYRLGLVRLPRLPAAVFALFAGWMLVSLLALDGWFFAVPDPRLGDFGQLSADVLKLDINDPWR